MHNTAPFLEKETHKFQWNFKIQTDYQISTRQPDLIIINTKMTTSKIVDFADHRVKLKENEKKNKYIDLAFLNGKKNRA